MPAASSKTEMSDSNLEIPMSTGIFKMILQETLDQLESSLDTRFNKMWQKIVGITTRGDVTPWITAAQLHRSTTNVMSTSGSISKDSSKVLDQRFSELDAKLSQLCKHVEVMTLAEARTDSSLREPHLGFPSCNSKALQSPGSSKHKHVADHRSAGTKQTSPTTQDSASDQETSQANADGSLDCIQSPSINPPRTDPTLLQDQKPVIVPHQVWVDGPEEEITPAQKLKEMLHTSISESDSGHIESISRTPTNATQENVQGFRCVIHPSTTRRLTWDIVGMCLIAFDTIWLPLYLSFEPTTSEVTEFPVLMFWITFVFWNADIVLAFFTGYYDDNGEVELRHTKIARKYVTTWFWLDCTLVGLDWVTLLSADESVRSGTGLIRMGKAFRGLTVLRSLRLLRLRKLVKTLEEIQDRISSAAVLDIWLSILKLMLILLTCNHMIACVWWSLGCSPPPGEVSWIEYHGFEHEDLGYRYVSALHWSLTQFTPAGMEVYPHNSRERIFAVILLVFALLFFSSFLSSITAAMTQLRQLNYATNRQFSLLRRLLKERQVSQDLSARIRQYLEHRIKAERARVQEQDVGILALLSEPLHRDLQEQTHKPILCKHPFFDQYCRVAPHAMRHLCQDALSMTFLSAGDTLFNENDKSEQMFFVVNGRLEHNWRHGSDLEPTSRYLQEGDWCDEACLWTQWVHTGNTWAVSDSNLLAVDAAKFISVTVQHTNVIQHTSKYAQLFVEDLNASFWSLSGLSKSKEEVELMVKRVFESKQSFYKSDRSALSAFSWLGPRFGRAMSNTWSGTAEALKKAIRTNSRFQWSSNRSEEAGPTVLCD